MLDLIVNVKIFVFCCCRKWVYFRLDLYITEADRRLLRPCSKQELKKQLVRIVEQTEG